MDLIENREIGNYYMMVQSCEVKSVIFPNLTRTDVQNRDNWIYDLTAPEPGQSSPQNKGGQADDEFD